MSGSAGGSRIPREALQKTVDSYIKKVLKGFKGFKSAKISGSYNTTDKQDFGDIDLIVNIESDLDKKTIKQDLVKHLDSLPEDLIVPFKSEKNKGKRSLNHGEIVTVLYPIEGMPGKFVQIDNIMSLSEEEGEFKKSVLDLPAEKQGLVLGLIKVVLLEEDPKKVFARMGIKNIDPLGPDEEYEFHVDTSGLTLKKVKLDKSGDKIRTIESTDVWKTSNFDDVRKLLSNFNIDGSFEDIVSDIKKFKNPRSKDRVKGWFLKNIRVQAGEMGTPKAEKKQYAIDTINALEGKYNSLVMSIIKPILNEIEEFSRTIALMPGAFKPPHKDHVKRINAAADMADKALVLISPLERAQEGQLPITAEQSLAIWNLYKEKGIIKDNVYFKVSPDNSPVKTAYDTIIANPQNKYIGVYGKEDAARWKNIETKYPNATASDFGIVADLSASDLRTALLNNKDISSFLPDGVTPEEYKQALGLNNIEESSPEIIETHEDEIYEETEPVIEYKTKESLNPEIWEGDKIKPELLEALLKVANKFYNDLNIYYPLEDILLVGSSANYNWTDLSDIDVHLLIDFSRVKDPQLFKDYVDSKKNEFNTKYDLKYKDHPVEVYVQDTNEPNASLGVYSLLNNEWIKHPDKEDIEIPDSEIEQKAEPLMNQIDDLIKDKTTSSEDVRDLKRKIKRFRQSGLSSDGEYSLENLAFKKLRYDGYLEKLSYLEKHINVKDFGLEQINEGAYDSITRTIVKDIMNDWKDQFTGKSDELEFENDYELNNSKGHPINIDLYAVLRVKETKSGLYKVDGGTDPDQNPPYLDVKFQVDPRDLPQKWETIYMDLTDVVRHEIEHLTQSGTQVVPSKEMENDDILRGLIKLKLLPKSDYFKLEQEIDAMLQGMYLKAKKSKIPFKDVISDYFDKVKLNKQDRKDILDIWSKRLKVLNLPPVQEKQSINENNISKILEKPLTSLTKYLISNININPLPKVKFINNDKENAENILGKTAHYDPNDRSITLYTLDRHPKDILRSFSHEMIHHNQNLEDRLNNINTNNTNEDGDLPEIEREAYEKGNMFFRNWEDSIKNSTLNEILIKKPFEFSKLLKAYEQDTFYKKNITKNGTILFHLYTDDLIEKTFPDPEDQQKAKDILESMYKEAGSNYVLIKDGRVIKPTVGLGQFADVIDSRWIKDRRKDQSEALLDSENNFKEIIKSDPGFSIKFQANNVVASKVNGQYVFFNYLTETVLGEFDKYDAVWSYAGFRNDRYIIKKDGKTGLATLKDGELTVNFDYEDTWDMGSKIYGYKDGYTYILDDNDKVIFKVKGKYRHIHPEDNDKFIVYKSDKANPDYGLITSEGEIIIPFSPGWLYKKGDYYLKHPIDGNSFSIFDENGKLLSKYDINFPSEANIRNFNQLEKILKVIPIEDLHKLFGPLEWSQIIAYSKDPKKTVELTQAGDIIAKFDDETLKDCLKRAPGAKKVDLLKIFKKYNNSPMLEKYYKKYNVTEIKINAPTNLNFNIGKIYRFTGVIDTEIFLADTGLNLVDLGSHYTFLPYADQQYIALVPKDQVIKNISYPIKGSLSKQSLNQLKNLYNSGNVIYNKPLQ